MNSPLPEEPLAASAPPNPATASDRKRSFRFCGSSFGVVRLEDLRETASLKADLVACYRPVNSQEMFALERMAIAQQLMLRAARLDAGLFTSAMNDVLDRSNEPIIPMDIDMVGDGDIEITRQQNRNYCIAEGFRRIAKESNLMTLALRYRVQAERDYRRALEEFQRLERLRPKLPNEPNLLTDPDPKDDVAPLKEINRWIRDEPVNQTKAKETEETKPAKQPESEPAPALEPVAPAGPLEPIVAVTPEPQAGNFPVAAIDRAINGSALPRSATKAGALSHAVQLQPETLVQRRPRKTRLRRDKHRQRSLSVSSRRPELLPPASEHNPPKPPQ